MRGVILVSAVTAVTLIMASGVALAVVRTGGPGDDYLGGTNGPDAPSGRGGDDVLLDLRGDDALYGERAAISSLVAASAASLRGDRALSGVPGGDLVEKPRGPQLILSVRASLSAQ